MNKNDYIFFSYKSEDAAFVRGICERLKAEGIPVWIDEYDIKYNMQDQFKAVISQAIDRTKWAVLFVNEPFSRSVNCQFEMERLSQNHTQDTIVLILSESETFNKRFARFFDKGNFFYTGYDFHQVMEVFKEVGLLKKDICFKEPSREKDEKTWIVMEAGFKFEYSEWSVNTSSRFTGMDNTEQLKFSKLFRTEYHMFECTISNHPVELLLDYKEYKGSQADTVLKRLENNGDWENIREKKYNEDDNQRMIEELKSFEKEAHIAFNRYWKNAKYFRNLPSRSTGKSRELLDIGIHKYQTKDRGKWFKHRLFTFREAGGEDIFRVYKLVLPHPQIDIAFTVRFIFRFNNDMPDFYRSIPWCDYLVSTFNWISEKPLSEINLTTGIIKEANRLFRGRGEK